MGLSVKNLTFCYQEKVILQDLSLEIGDGALGVLLGANGAGKSTLIRCICGLLKPLQGEIYCNGIETASLPAVKRARFFGYVPQGNHVEPGLSVMETLLFQRERPTNEMLEKAASILLSFGLGDFASRYTHCLSGGERQRVLIARALLQEPSALILDEPVSNLDLKYQFETMELLRAVCREKNTVILTALHDVNMASAYGDIVFLLHEGRVYSAGAPCSAVSQENVGVVFDVDVDVFQINERKWIVPKLKNN